MKATSFLCNILWLIIVGWESALSWFIVGIIYCITIIGIPCGMQAFKIGMLALWPFGKEIKEGSNSSSCCALCGNLIWFFFGGLEIAIAEFFMGLLCCMTIIGIPFGLQLFKIGRLALWPYGAKIVEEGSELDQKLITNNITVTNNVVYNSAPVYNNQIPQYGPLVSPIPEDKRTIANTGYP